MSEEKPAPGFPLLGAVSYYSLLSGARSPEELCARAVLGGYDAIALTDSSNLYALPAFVDAAESRGLKPLAGVAFESDPGETLYAWALTREGFGRLCFLVSMAHDKERNSARAILAELCSGGWDGLVVASDCPKILEPLAKAEARPRGYGPLDALYAALLSGRPTVGAARTARALGLRCLAVAGGRICGPEDPERLRLLAAVDRRITVSALSAMDSWADPADEAPLPDAGRALAEFSAYPDAVASARALAEIARPASAFFSSPPAFPSWRGLNEEDAYRALRSACAEGIVRRYGDEGAARLDVNARLDKELAILRAKGFSSYFLVVRDIVSTCPRTCGRGSAASSIVSYLLGLTHVDPLARDLFFERFLNEGRNDPPDIDIDFPWDEREGVLARVFKEYAGSAAIVADHCRFSGASMVREAALAFGMSLDETDRHVREWRRNGSQALPEGLAAAAALLKNLPRYIGTHPGGVVIVPGPMHRYAPVQPGLSGFPVLAWEKDGAERAGLVKIDLLGNRSLAVLRDCLELCSREAEPPPAARSWEAFNPVDEPSARALIESGGTIGVFYIESPATRQLLLKMRVADYSHLVAASSIIRPAANRYVNEYVRRLRGESWERLPESVESCLKETYGIMVYQEDVSRVSMAAAGFSAEDADRLRKTLSKKRGSPKLAEYRERFFAGCAERGVGEAATEELWAMMLSFDGYSFCKAHSASYALVSYRLAWMKANRPGYFIASVINNGGGFYGTQAYLGEARRLGFRILPPSVNESGLAYMLDPADPSSLRVGLRQVRSLSDACASSIVRERAARGAFTSALDLMRRIDPAYLDYRALARSGCLDSLPLADGAGQAAIRPALLWAYHHWRSGPQRDCAELFPTLEPPACIRDYTRAKKLADEKEFLGLLVSTPPAALFQARALALARSKAWPTPSPAENFPARIGRRTSALGIAVAGKEVFTVNGDAMCFMSFEDGSCVYECVLFPQAYRLLMPILEENGAFLLLGTVRDDLGAVALHVDDAASLNRPSRGER